MKRCLSVVGANINSSQAKFLLHGGDKDGWFTSKSRHLQIYLVYSLIIHPSITCNFMGPSGTEPMSQRLAHCFWGVHESEATTCSGKVGNKVMDPKTWVVCFYKYYAGRLWKGRSSVKWEGVRSDTHCSTRVDRV